MPNVIHKGSGLVSIHTKEFKGGSPNDKHLSAGIVRLAPGTNNLTPKQWDLIKTHPHVVRMIDNGILKIVTEKGLVEPKAAKASGNGAAGSAPASRIENLLGMPQGDAVELATETMEEPTLQAWLEAEKTGSPVRGAVCKALAEQIKKVKNADQGLGRSSSSVRPGGAAPAPAPKATAAKASGKGKGGKK